MGSIPYLVFVMSFFDFAAAVLADKLGVLINKALNLLTFKKEDNMENSQKTFSNAFLFKLAQTLVIGIIQGNNSVSALLS
jgi:hypothetical protein